MTYQPYPYFWGYRDINDPFTNWDFESHFQSEKYFAHCIDLIRFYFEMHDEKNYSNCVAVHMRFGDYDDSYHPRPKKEYYNEAIKHIPLGTMFMLFSDDIDAAMEVWKTLDTKVYPITPNGDYIESFKIMKNCKHFICGNSSYSLMAAILSDQPGKIVVCPKKWFGDHVDLSDNYI